MSFELSVFFITQRHQLVSKGHWKLLERPTYPIHLIQMMVALGNRQLYTRAQLFEGRLAL